jgi:hypothetical protein
MSFDDGWAALNLEMPPRVPRTEYSAQMHWDLMAAVTGVPVRADSPEEIKGRARRIFVDRDHWNFDLFWNTLIGGPDLEPYRSRMGHAEYAAAGADRDDRVYCAFAGPDEVLRFDPREKLRTPPRNELVRRFEEHVRGARATHPDGVNMTGVYVTAVSGLIDLLGWDLLLETAGLDARGLGALVERYSQWLQPFFDALAEADAPVVMVHDDLVWTSGPFIHPDWYRAYVFPALRRYLAPLRAAGKKVLFTSDGNYTAFVDDIAACGATGFVLEPMTDMALIAGRYGRTHAFVGNVDTRALLQGPRAAIRAEVERCMAIGKGCPGFFLAVGNHIPPNTPVENALYYNEVYESLSRR